MYFCSGINFINYTQFSCEVHVVVMVHVEKPSLWTFLSETECHANGMLGNHKKQYIHHSMF